MCGQSGSGKTYSLGLLLERVLAETSLRVVILDPNSDHVRLAHLRDDADPTLAARYADVPADVAVWSNDPGAAHALRLQFADLAPASPGRGARPRPGPGPGRVRGADRPPASDRSTADPWSPGPSSSWRPRTRRPCALGQRASNLGVLGWDIWDPAAPSLVEELRDPTARCTVDRPRVAAHDAGATRRRRGHPVDAVGVTADPTADASSWSTRRTTSARPIPPTR